MFPADGGCDCRYVRYRVMTSPLAVNCCHCRWCQRQTGASFALNALIEADCVKLVKGNIAEITVPSPGGYGQKITRCPDCQVALWSNYEVMFSGNGHLIRFVRVGTLDEPDLIPPDVHIYTSTKQPWVVLSPDIQSVDEYYDTEKTWSLESLERKDELLKSAGIQ